MSLVSHVLDYICQELSNGCKIKVDWDYSFDDEIKFKFGLITIKVSEKQLDPMTIYEIINKLTYLYFELTIDRGIREGTFTLKEDKE